MASGDVTSERRDYGTGSLFQRKSDGRWIGTIEAGWTQGGSRRRITVSGKGCVSGCPKKCAHRTAIKRRLERKRAELEKGEATTGRTTVKAWVETYLAMRVHDLRPKAYNAAASPLRKWVIPTIGHRRLDSLTPADMRAVGEAQRAAGLKTATQAATHRALLTMLRAAITEGHNVPPRVLLVKAPQAAKSDREGMTVPEGLAALRVAGTLPHGTRWLTTLLYGARQGECLGLTWDAINFDGGEFGEIIIEWQLQALPYIDRTNKRLGFRVPDGFESRHLVDSWHLVRPKSKQGYRVAPLLPPVRDALLRWREVAPVNPWGLVWPTAEGRPANNKHDLLEWHALQGTAGIGHPAGRPYHVHECRNFAATMLFEAEVPEHIITALLGHSSIIMSRKYMSVRREPLLDALTRVGERLQLG